MELYRPCMIRTKSQMFNWFHHSIDARWSNYRFNRRIGFDHRPGSVNRDNGHQPHKCFSIIKWVMVWIFLSWITIETESTFKFQNCINSILNDDTENWVKNAPKWIPPNLNEYKDRQVKVKLLCGADLLESFANRKLWNDTEVSDLGPTDAKFMV